MAKKNELLGRTAYLIEVDDGSGYEFYSLFPPQNPDEKMKGKTIITKKLLSKLDLWNQTQFLREELDKIKRVVSGHARRIG